MNAASPIDTQAYIAGFPASTQKILEQVRSTIRKAAPNAVEVISYKMPAFKMNKVLVWYAGYEKHIGFYPGGKGIEAFKEEISAYKWGKGSVQFPLDQKMPLGLITKIVKYKVKEDQAKAKKK